MRNAVSLPGNVLPINSDVLNHYEHLRNKLKETDSRFLKTLPGFLDVKQELVSDVVNIWFMAGLHVISEVRVIRKRKEVLNKFQAARKKAIKKKQEVKGAWSTYCLTSPRVSV